MDVVIDNTLRTFVADCTDLFGEKSSFLQFEAEPIFSSSDGLQSSSLFGRIVYKNENESTCRSPSLMLKTIAKRTAYFVAYKLEFMNEIFFYTEVLPHFSSLRDIGHLFPEYYNSQVHVNRNVFRGVIMFENLQADGFKTSDSKSFLDYDHLALMMRKIGEFHAYSYRAKKLDPLQFSDQMGAFKETNFFLLACWSDILEITGLRGVGPLRHDPRYSFKVAELEEFVKSSSQFMKHIFCQDKANPLAVLCHGDYLRSNVLFKYDQGRPVDLKIIDMASCKVASPVVDLAQVLYLNTDQQMRDDHWDDLIDEYYRALKDTFANNEVPSKDDILAEIRCKASSAYFIASYFMGWLVAMEYNLPSLFDLLPVEYTRKDVGLLSIPREPYVKCILAIGGDLATEKLAVILKDMIDRGFL